MIRSRSAAALGGLVITPLLLLASCGDSGTSRPPVAAPAPAVGATADRAARAHSAVLVRPASPTRLVVDGPTTAVGSRGPVVTYSIEVYRDVNRPRQRASELASIATAALGDLDRGWTATGTRRLVRIDDPTKARIRIVLARPARVDRYCAQAGLRTAGRYSCFNGRVAALNMWRWRHGAKGFRSLEQYRTYVVNHEVGHGLGYSHRYCPGRRAIAPVMQQQTKSLRGCRANPWPYR